MRRLRDWLRLKELFWLLATVAPAYAQHYPILRVPGSPPGILSIFEDSHSALWVGTKEDVFCFDGRNFYSLRQTGLPAGRATNLAADDEGGIWIALQFPDTQSGLGKGALYRFQDGKTVHIFDGIVSSIVAAAPGKMLATVDWTKEANTFGDLYLVHQDQRKWLATKVLDKAARYLSEDLNGSILFICPQERCELSRKQIIDWPNSGLKPQSIGMYGPKLDSRKLGFGEVDTILRDRSGCIWLRTENMAAYQCSDFQVSHIPLSVLGPDSSASLTETEDGYTLLQGSGLVIAKPTDLHEFQVEPGDYREVRAMNGLPTGLNVEFPARDGTIFLGTDDGLFRFMYPLRLEYWNQGDGVEGPYSILHAGGKTYYSNLGINVLDENRMSWSRWTDPKQVGTTVHMIPGPAGSIYAASLGFGATQLSPSGSIIAQTKGGKADGGARLAQDSQGRIWLAGNGITELSRKGNFLEFDRMGTPTGISLDMEYDPKRRALWACDEREVLVLKENQWTHITKRDGLLDDECRSITVLPTDEVWVGYAHIGSLSRIRQRDASSFHIDSFPADAPIHDGDNFFLDSDSRGLLWLGSNQNDYVAIPDSAPHGDWLKLDAQDGIPEPGGNQNSFYSDPDGSIWFGSGNTIVHFDPPPDFATHFPSPPIFIAGMKVGTNTPILWNGVPAVAHGANLAIQVGSLQFDRRNGIRFRYRVLPGQTGWKETDNFELPLGMLHSGQHTIELQGRLVSGEWSEVQRASFRVLWPFWLTWPMLLGYCATGAGISIGIVQWNKWRRSVRETVLPDLATWRMKALSPESGDLIGTVVDGRYEIGHILSIGGFATVVRARDFHRDGILCAVKLFRFEIGNEAWVRHRFEQEVTALERFSHPNIVKITGHGTTGSGMPYLVMEFIHGQNLRDLLESGALHPVLIARFMAQIASALATLHQSEIFHRDLKPENFMIRADEDNQQQIVLIDFSIAIVKSPEETFHGISRVAGTLQYMAPEQVIGYADATTDIYSLAKVFMEMLTGLPWANLLPQATLDLPEQVRGYLVTHQQLLSNESIEMIASALMFDPGRRPNSIYVFAEPIIRDLERIG